LGIWLYRKPEPPTVRGPCVKCGLRQQRSIGKQGFAPVCEKCHDERSSASRLFRKRPYRAELKNSCEECGFIPVHLCQLDVDHIDGNHDNNDPSNLKTLCANCHRLKTLVNEDWHNPQYRQAG